MLTVFRTRFSAWLSQDNLLKSRDFRNYWASGVMAQVGNVVGTLALPLCAVLILHATPAQMGILTACSAIPFAVFALPAGVWLDRHYKLPILLASKLVQAAALLVIPLAYWLGILSMPWLYALAALQGTCAIVGGGAEQVLLNLLVGRGNMVEAQSRFATSDSVVKLTAPGLAGLLIQWLSAPIALIINAAGYVLSLLLMRRVKLEEPAPEPTDKHPLADIADGFRFIFTQRLLCVLVTCAGFWHLIYFGYAAMAVIFATRDLGMTAGQLGAAQILGGLGVMFSAIIMRPLDRNYGPGVTILIGTVMSCAVFILMALLPAKLFGSATATFFAYAGLTFLFDCGVLLFFVPYVALRQKVTPDAMMGRMISTTRFLTTAIAPLGALTTGYIASHSSTRTALACVSVGGLALLAGMMMSKQIRSVRS